MKKIVVFLIVSLLACCLVLTVHADEEEPPVLPEDIEEYVNIRSASCALTINTSGTATIQISCFGYSGTTNITSRTYLEKWNGSTWVRVKINGLNEITENVNASYLLKTYTTSVGSGTYRATAVFTVTINTSETVTARSNSVTH